MALREHFVESGHWLFKRRSWLPVIPFLLVAWGLVGYEYPDGSRDLHRTWGLFCLAVGFVGVVIRALTIGYIAGNTSGRNRGEQVADSLNTSGVYSVVRHPLYLGNYFMYLAPALLPLHPWIPVVVSLLFWIYYERIMAAEEDFLRQKFGPAYDAWANETPAFFPALGQWRSEERPFSIRMVLRREHSGIFGLIVTMAVLAMAADMSAAGEIRFDPLWLWILGATTAVFVVVVLLKRHTGVLEVTDR